VLPRITTTVTLSQDRTHYVIKVTVAGAETGDYVALARNAGDSWTTLRRVRLPDAMRVTFSVPVPANGTVQYRIRVPRTQLHGEGDAFFVATAPSG